MSEAGKWVPVEGNASDDPDWNKGKWRSSKAQYTYIDGIFQGNEIPPLKWEKWVPDVVVPIEPGVYFDKSDDIWILNSAHEWLSFDYDNFYQYGSGVTEYAQNYAPFRPAVVKEEK